MPGWLKVLLIVALVLVLLVGGVVGAGIFWWVRNKDAVVGRLKEVATEGKDFGSHSDNKGCVDETMSRYKREPGFTNAISDSIFMRTCLDASKPTAGFCDSVPGRTEFIKSGQWRVEQCSQYDLRNDQYCQQLFQPVQDYCNEKRARSSE